MGLQGDQRALLQLLVERGQSYEDIAGLLGGTPDEVRERARAALAEIGGSDPDAEVGLTDFLLGQADPIGRADAIRHLQGDPETLDLARKIQTGLAVIAPDASQPSLPEPRTKRRKAALPDASDGPAAPAAPADPEEAAAARRRNAILAGLIAVGLALTVAAGPIFGYSDRAADEVLDRGQYIRHTGAAPTHAAKEDPHPQVVWALGLRITNCVPSRPSR